MVERDPRIIGDRIAKLRHQRDMTQIELAEALGVSPSTVADWERGARFPKRKLGKIEQFFGKPVDYDDETGAPPAHRSASPDEALERMEAAMAELRKAIAEREQGKEEGRHEARYAV